MCVLYAPAPVLCGLPHPPAAPSLGTSSHHVLEYCALVRTTLRPLNDPSESPPSPSGKSGVPTPLSQRSCAALIPLQQPSVNTVETPENSAHMFTDHTDAACPESGCCESSLTVFSIVKNQKIVNTILRKTLFYED